MAIQCEHQNAGFDAFVVAYHQDHLDELFDPKYCRLVGFQFKNKVDGLSLEEVEGLIMPFLDDGEVAPPIVINMDLGTKTRYKTPSGYRLVVCRPHQKEVRVPGQDEKKRRTWWSIAIRGHGENSYPSVMERAWVLLKEDVWDQTLKSGVPQFRTYEEMMDQQYKFGDRFIDKQKKTTPAGSICGAESG